MQRMGLIVVFVLLTIVAFTGCGGGSQPTSTETPVAVNSGLVWPPPTGSHLASAYTEQQAGTDFITRGGNTGEISDQLIMVGGGELPWAMYTIGDLEEGNELVSIDSDFIEIPDEAGDGTKLYFAIANYELGTWEWITLPEDTPWYCLASEAENYRDSEGWATMAVVLNGPGYGRIQTVTFEHESNINWVDPPQNLVATTPAPNQVDLVWDAVEGADGYNIYRSSDKHFLSQNMLNSELVTNCEYTDTPSTDGKFYFYRVTAKGEHESAHSNTVKTWVFGDDLPAPGNLRVTERATDSFSIAWDWDDPVGGNPYGFSMFIDTIPGFTLESETMIESTTFGSDRSNTFHGLQPGVAYYVRVCAYDGLSDPYGRISDEETGGCSGFWTWGEVEVVGEGRAAVRMVNGDGTLAVSYFNSTNIYFAIQDSAEENGWRVEPALANGEDYFMDYQDLCYGGGTYLVTTHSTQPGDCWVADWSTTDTAGAWEPYRVDGDGGAYLGAMYSGYHATCAASDTEFAVAHFQVNNRSLFLHTRDIDGGAWSLQTFPGLVAAGGTPAFSLCFNDDNLYMLCTDSLLPELFFGDRTGEWDWEDILPAGAVKLPAYHDLHYFQDEFWSPAHTPADKDHYMIHGTTAPWVLDRTDYTGNCGYYTRMDVEGEEAAVIQYKDNQFYFAVYSEGWDWQTVNIPGVDSVVGEADVVLMDGAPYIAFEDDDTGMISVVKGYPPEE